MEKERDILTFPFAGDSQCTFEHIDYSSQSEIHKTSSSPASF